MSRNGYWLALITPQAIRTGQPAQTSGQDNLWSFAAVTAGVESAKTGRSVEVASLLS
jgi:hypothetical protein